MSETTRTEFEARAAESGAGATEAFRKKQKASLQVPAERVSAMATEALEAIHDVIRRHQMTYEEYDALKAWLIGVGEDGEWPLFLDVWVEHVVEDVNTSHREGNKGSIEGPYYVPDAPELGHDGTLPMRDDEPGTALEWTGQVTSTSGEALGGAKVELWQADANGFYSQYAPGLPEWNLRGTFTTDDQGRFSISTIQPAPYQIPTDGACGKLIAAADWHAWRPAHLHVKVSAPGHELLTAPALLPRRRAQRRRHRLGGQAGADPGPAGRPRRPDDRLLLRPGPGVRRRPDHPLTRGASTVLFMVRMTVTLPPDLDPEVRGQLVAAERDYSQQLQREGRIAGIWRVAGQFANYCLFDVESADELHELVSGLPMFGYIRTEVEALATHPNAIR